MKRLLLISLLTVIVFSCLEPMGDNFVDIPRPDESKFRVSLNDYQSGDTIYVDAVTTFFYEVFPDTYIADVKTRFDDQEIYTSYTQFQINPANYAAGIHRLYFQAVVSTFSGSLASMVVGESVTVNREFVVIIENAPPALPGMQLDTTTGTVIVRWNKCQKKNFVSYVITKYCAAPWDDYSISSCKTITITDVDVLSWTDHDYVGRLARYRVDVFTTLHSSGEEKELQWHPKLVTDIDDGYATLRWRKPFFYANINKAQIHSWQISPLPQQISITDTSFTIPHRLNFGYEYELSLQYFPVDEYSPRGWRHYYAVGKQHSYPSVMPTLFHPEAKLFYGYQHPRTVIMDENLNMVAEIQDENFHERHISSNNEYFITAVNGNFYSTDPYTLELELLYETGEQYTQPFSIGDNGFVCYPATNAFRVVDIATGELKFTIPLEGFIATYLSPSGKYLIAGGKKIYAFNGSTFVFKGELDNYYSPFSSMLFLYNDNILTSEQGQLVEYDISTLAPVSTIETGLEYALGGLQQDPVTKKISCVQQNRYYVLDLDNKKLDNVSTYHISVLRLLNNTLLAAIDYYEFHSIDCSYIEQP